MVQSQRTEEGQDHGHLGDARRDGDQLLHLALLEIWVAEARADFPQAARGKVEITYIYIVGERDKLLGVVDSKKLLPSDGDVRLQGIMSTKVVTLGPHIE